MCSRGYREGARGQGSGASKSSAALALAPFSCALQSAGRVYECAHAFPLLLAPGPWPLAPALQ